MFSGWRQISNSNRMRNICRNGARSEADLAQLRHDASSPPPFFFVAVGTSFFQRPLLLHMCTKVVSFFILYQDLSNKIFLCILETKTLIKVNTSEPRTAAARHRYRREAHIGSKVRTNPPSFAKFRFFSCSLYERAPCLVITRLCSSNAEIWSNGTVNVCTKAVRWASPRPRLRCDRRRRVHFSSSSIAQRAVCHS